MNTISLNGRWQLEFEHPQTGNITILPADVPREAEIILYENGILEDLMPPDIPTALEPVKNTV